MTSVPKINKNGPLAGINNPNGLPLIKMEKGEEVIQIRI
jgi:hypothetical protein